MDDKVQNNDDLAVLWVQAQPTVSAFIVSVVPNFHAADDILQNVALVTTRRIADYDRNLPFAAWAIGIAKKEIQAYFRSKKKEHLLLDANVIESIAQTIASPDSDLDTLKRSMEQALRTCLDKLGKKWRHVVELFYLREQDTQRIAQQLVMSHVNVRVTLHRIRRALRECVSQHLPPEGL